MSLNRTPLHGQKSKLPGTLCGSNLGMALSAPSLTVKTAWSAQCRESLALSTITISDCCRTSTSASHHHGRANDVLTLPREAVRMDDTKPYVYQVVEWQTKRRDVDVSLQNLRKWNHRRTPGAFRSKHSLPPIPAFGRWQRVKVVQ